MYFALFVLFDVYKVLKCSEKKALNKMTNVVIIEDCLLERITVKHSLSLIKNIKVLGDFECAELFFESGIINSVDIILLDLNLTGMNGIKAARKIKHINPSVKIIVLTEHVGKDFLIASMFSGANGFTNKDTDKEKLEKIIKAVSMDAIWIDPCLLNTYKEIFPKPDSYELFNLYKKDDNKFSLTQREMEVLKLLAEGKTNTQIAKEMIVSINTAKAHVANILYKMNAIDRVQAAVIAVKSNII